MLSPGLGCGLHLITSLLAKPLVPKLRLGTHIAKLLLRGLAFPSGAWERGPSSGPVPGFPRPAPRATFPAFCPPPPLRYFPPERKNEWGVNFPSPAPHSRGKEPTAANGTRTDT